MDLSTAPTGWVEGEKRGGERIVRVPTRTLRASF
jgi:hypothetical protein